MRGRKPKPSAVRELHNSKQRPYHGNDVEIPDTVDVSLVKVPPAPASLDASERKYWNQFAPLLASAKLLTPADVETLGSYCVACAAVAHRKRLLASEFRKKQPDYMRIKTFDIQLRGWVEKQTSLASELGLTAVSRTRAGWSGHKQVIDKKEKPQSKLAQLQEQAAALRRPVALK